MGRIIAIDYGRARIGLAMTDEAKKIGMPYKTIASGKTIALSAKNVIDALKIFLPHIEKFVLGLPLMLSGKKGEMALEVEQFKVELEKITAIPVCLWDERLTSAQAESSLKEMNMTRKKRAQKSDPVAACIILQNFMDASQN